MNKKTIISLEEYNQVEATSLAAKEFLNDERFQFIRNLYQNHLKYAEETLLNDSIREYQDVTSLTDKITRIFKVPKKVQVDELRGQYKWLKQFVADVEYMAGLKDQYDEGIEKGMVIFEPGTGKDVRE